jgi:hypothetical protein
MCKLKWNFLLTGLIACLVLISAATAGAFTVNVKPMTDDTVLRVLYYGGLKGNIAPCG